MNAGTIEILQIYSPWRRRGWRMAIGGATGAAKGLENLDALRRELRAIKYDGVLDEAG